MSYVSALKRGRMATSIYLLLGSATLVLRYLKIGLKHGSLLKQEVLAKVTYIALKPTENFTFTRSAKSLYEIDIRDDFMDFYLCI
jgi:hypothetical protein